ADVRSWTWVSCWALRGTAHDRDRLSAASCGKSVTITGAWITAGGKPRSGRTDRETSEAAETERSHGGWGGSAISRAEVRMPVDACYVQPALCTARLTYSPPWVTEHPVASPGREWPGGRVGWV